MVPQGQSVDRRRFGRKGAMALCVLAVMPLARRARPARASITTAAPLELPHSLNLVLAEMARKRNRKPDNIESHSFLALTPGLQAGRSGRANSDVRARLVTPEIKRTPVVGWIANNLYRSKDENGWCVELDPGEGEYVVFYRFHPSDQRGSPPYTHSRYTCATSTTSPPAMSASSAACARLKRSTSSPQIRRARRSALRRSGCAGSSRRSSVPAAPARRRCR